MTNSYRVCRNCPDVVYGVVDKNCQVSNSALCSGTMQRKLALVEKGSGGWQETSPAELSRKCRFGSEKE